MRGSSSGFTSDHFFFFRFRFDLKRKEHDDITERLALRRKLGCKNFKWYLNNIYPELEIPDDNYLATGEVSVKLLEPLTELNFLNNCH